MEYFQDDISSLSHDKLVELAQVRNVEAFAILFQYHRSGVYRYVAGLVGNGEDAHDLTQSTFLKAWERLPTLRDVSKFKAWLYRIARNLTYDCGRRKERVSFQSWESLVEQTIALSKPGPEEVVAQAELVQLALAEVPPHFRECLILQTVGFSQREIAELTGINVASVRTYVSNAHRLVREAYQRLEQVPDDNRKRG